MEYEIASPTLDEQETIINRVRSDGDMVNVYSSDTRVVKRILRLYPNCKKIIHALPYGEVKNIEKRVIWAVEIDIPVTEIRRGIFLPRKRIWKEGTVIPKKEVEE